MLIRRKIDDKKNGSKVTPVTTLEECREYTVMIIGDNSYFTDNKQFEIGDLAEIIKIDHEIEITEEETCDVTIKYDTEIVKKLFDETTHHNEIHLEEVLFHLLSEAMKNYIDDIENISDN